MKYLPKCFSPSFIIQDVHCQLYPRTLRGCDPNHYQIYLFI